MEAAGGGGEKQKTMGVHTLKSSEGDPKQGDGTTLDGGENEHKYSCYLDRDADDALDHALSEAEHAFLLRSEVRL